MQIYQLLKNIRNLFFIFISMSIIVAGIEGSLDASNREIKSVRGTIISKGIGGLKKSEEKKLRLPFDELTTFTSAEYIWKDSKFVKTLWYKRK